MRLPSLYLVSLLVAGCAHHSPFGVETRLAMTQAALEAELSDVEVVRPDTYEAPSSEAERATPYSEPVDEEPEVDLSSLSPKERRRVRREKRRAERKKKQNQATVAKAIGPKSEGTPVEPEPSPTRPAYPVVEDEELAIPVEPVRPSAEPSPYPQPTAQEPVGVGPAQVRPAQTPRSPTPASQGPAVVVVPRGAAPPPAAPTIPALIAQNNGSDERLVAAVEKISHSLDEQRWAQLLEARLADKQRLIDRLQSDVDHVRQGSSAPPPRVSVAPVISPRGDNSDMQRQLLELERRQADAFAALRDELHAKPAPQPSPELAALRAQLKEQAEKTQALQQKLLQTKSTPSVNPELEALKEQLNNQAEELKKLKKKKAGRKSEDPNAELLRRLERQERLLREATKREPKEDSSDRRVEELLRAQQAKIDARLERLERLERRKERLIERATPAKSSEEPSPELKKVMEELRKTRESIEAEHEKKSEQRASTEAKLKLLEAELERARSAPSEDAEDLRARLDELEQERSRIDGLEGEMKTLRAERARLESEVEAANEARRQELEAERAANAKRTAELEGNLRELRERTAQMEKLYTEQYASVLAQLQPLIDAGLDVRVVAGKIRLQLPSDVLFSSGSTHLSKQGKKDIREVAQALDPFRSLLIQVEGHTDNVPVRSFQYDSNLDLAFARAKSVMQILLDEGLSPERVSAASFGDSRPVASNETKQGRAQNRRIEMVLQLEQDLDSTNK